MTPRAVVVFGPTASGKSALALALAERDGGCVINADAAQVYGCWRILTARPDDSDLAAAPHVLYGHVDCAARYSTGAWLRDVAAALADVRARGLRPIVVGGTGLYLAALTEGLAEIPATPPELRVRSEALIRAGGLGELRAELAAGDPETFARLDPSNPRRIQRAWEVLVATGRGLVAWHAETVTPLLRPEDCVRVALSPDPSKLNDNITIRFHRMLEDGAIDECRRFLAAGLDRDLPSARVLGAAPLFAFLAGETDLATATGAAVTATRQFAKRQRTWMRNRFRDWPRLDAAEDPLAAIPRS
ncbi:MAG: tRNA (adenosine(37)-N6)-dimethylallyltransferase MiaA [Amaricoccus sp.]